MILDKNCRTRWLISAVKIEPFFFFKEKHLTLEQEGLLGNVTDMLTFAVRCLPQKYSKFFRFYVNDE